MSLIERSLNTEAFGWRIGPATKQKQFLTPLEWD